MQGVQSLKLDTLDHDDVKISSGITKLDKALLGDNGFKPGIYDISGSVGYVGLGCYEIIFNVMIEILSNGEKVLSIESINKIPWFKLRKRSKFQDSFNNQIDCIRIENLIDLIILFNNKIDDDYSIIIIDSFPILYSDYLKNLKKIVNTETNSEPIIKFYQSLKKLFHLMQVNTSRKTMIFTVGTMDIFTQRVLMHDSQLSVDEDHTNSSSSSYINQQILVPTISLKSDLNSYYNNRIIIYRDWVVENMQNELTSGLKELSFEESIQLLNNGKLKCLPHYLCITPNPIHLDESRDDNKRNTNNKINGFFLIDNQFQILDIEHAMGLVNEDVEIPDSQG